MEVSNEATTVKKETAEDHEQGDNEIFIKVEPEYLCRYYEEDDFERASNEGYMKDEENGDPVMDGSPKNENDGTHFDNIADNSGNNDSCDDTASNADICTNNQTVHSGARIIAWDHKKNEYVYASFPSTSRFTKQSESERDGTLEEEKKFQCSQCPYATNRKHHFQRHELVHKKEPRETANADKQKRFQCTQCSYTTDHSSDIKRHGLKHSKKGREKFKCKDCDYTTYHKYHLLGHMSKRHTVTFSKFSCNYCQKIFKSKQSLDDHNIKCHPNLDFSFSSKILSCTNCEFKTALKRSLVRHNILHHSEGKAPLYECETCGHKTPLQSNYVLHIRKHADVKPYGCSGCDKGFLLKRSLDEHIIRVHSESEELIKSMTYKILPCEQCDFRTVKCDVLKSHIASSHQTVDEVIRLSDLKKGDKGVI
ncbi:unnamed protein product [Callosobruchus maculatus]|uniref:C2H2-type domain-containing protein n=1 Tax=Callosobruchus maculatus TaxID=64391 RepID=A0A653D4N1_CALMS|nr:unnamed protein product [Callosobruchus maculatus]